MKNAHWLVLALPLVLAACPGKKAEEAAPAAATEAMVPPPAEAPAAPTEAAPADAAAPANP